MWGVMGRRSAFGALFFVTFLAASGLSSLPVAPLLIPSAYADEPGRTAISAVDAAFKGQMSQAQDLAERSGDPAAVKMVELIYLRDKGKLAGYQRIMRFLDEAPNWPLYETLMRRAEQALYINRESTETVLAHFSARKPQTSEGMLALARAYLATGDQAAARQWLSKAWERPQLDAATEQQALSEFGGLITANDHKRRVAALIYAQETNAAIPGREAPAARLSGSGADRTGPHQECVRLREEIFGSFLRHAAVAPGAVCAGTALSLDQPERQGARRIG